MEFNDLATALMVARRKAQLAGRPLSQQEAKGVSQGYFQDAGERNLQGRAINFAEKHWEDTKALEKYRRKSLMKAANRLSINELISNLANSGIALWGMKE
jgi:hypothetical protein